MTSYIGCWNLAKNQNSSLFIEHLRRNSPCKEKNTFLSLANNHEIYIEGTEHWRGAHSDENTPHSQLDYLRYDNCRHICRYLSDNGSNALHSNINAIHYVRRPSALQCDRPPIIINNRTDSTNSITRRHPHISDLLRARPRQKTGPLLLGLVRRATRTKVRCSVYRNVFTNVDVDVEW